MVQVTIPPFKRRSTLLRMAAPFPSVRWNTQEAELLIDKAITLEGPGTDDLTIAAPINANAITITADQVSISGLSIESTRNGILIAGGSSIELTNLFIAGVGNWAISVDEGTERHPRQFDP